MRILVVEDEAFLADLVAKGLRRQAMAVDVAYDGDTAMSKVFVRLVRTTGLVGRPAVAAGAEV